MERIDLCVIGAGPSGYAAAMRALDFGKRVLLIEKNLIGGAGIHNGALSSKAWWELSRDYYSLRKNAAAFHFNAPKLNFKRLKKEITRATFDRRDLLEFHMRELSKHNQGLFTFLQGTARLVDKHTVEVSSDGSNTKFEAEYIILATGSQPRRLPSLPIDGRTVFTSDEIDALEDWPSSMVIVGAGVIGCEFATIFSNFGSTKVNLIDKGDRILPFEDEDVVHVIERNLERKGVLIHRNSQLTEMRTIDNEIEYQLEYSNGRKELFHVEQALVSVGRVPNYKNLGLEEIGIEMNERGIIDKDTQTSIPNIYAVGDITADIALVNVGELEGRYAAERIFGKPEHELIYENISTIMFLEPEVAGVGLNEIQAQSKGIDYKVASVNYNCISRAVAMRNTEGFIKMLVSNDEKMRILGMRVVGEHASSAIQAAALLISMGQGVASLAELIHPHPSIIEGIQECARMLLGKSTLKPSVLQSSMTCKVYTKGVLEDVR